MLAEKRPLTFEQWVAIVSSNSGGPAVEGAVPIWDGEKLVWSDFADLNSIWNDAETWNDSDTWTE